MKKTILKNQCFYNSSEYRELLDNGINGYNEAIHAGDIKKAEQWQRYILKWISFKYLITQLADAIDKCN